METIYVMRGKRERDERENASLLFSFIFYLYKK